MPHVVDFTTVSTEGLESSPVAEALAGLRANEARYFRTKYDHEFTTYRPEERPELVEYVARVLREERGLEFASPVLEVAEALVDGIRWTHAFHESGLAVNVLYTLADGGKRAVGFKLAEGMEVPAELEGRFKFARQRSKLAGEIRGTFFVVKGEHDHA